MILTQHGINALPTSGGGGGIVYGKVVIDGKEYKTVMIGNHEWMAENLASDSFGGKWYNNSQAHPEYGKYYRYTELAAINSGVPGWHIPTLDETEEMFADLLGISPDDPNRKTDAYSRKDELFEGFRSESGWDNTTGNGTNAYGFNIFPNGSYCYDEGDYFEGAGKRFHLWLGYYRSGQNYMWWSYSNVDTTITGMGDNYAYSYGIRLIKDS